MDCIANNISSFASFKPEITLLAGILIIFIFDLFLGSKKTVVIFLSIAVLALVFLFLCLDFAQGDAKLLFNGFIVTDRYATFFKLLFVAATFFIILISSKSLEFKGASISEIILFLLGITLGMMLLASSSDLLMIYLSLETVSLLSYVLVGYKIDSRPSSEAALKYIIYGGVTSGVMLFGLSYLYGIFGTTNLPEINSLILKANASSLSYPILFVSILIFAGFGFKIAMVPFHQWCPDVYEGAPTPITAFLSIGPKAAGLAVFFRFVFMGFMDGGDKFSEIAHLIKLPNLIMFLSIITMTLGNLAAISQNNLKRLLAYSSIAHAGYLLMGLAVLNREGVEAILFYLPIYLFMNLGAFLIVIIVRDLSGSEDIKAYASLGKTHPFLAVSMAIFMFSLTGLPPFSGFLGKFYIFAAVINKGYYILATIGVINSVISLFYYARIVKAMFLEENRGVGSINFRSCGLTTCNVYTILTAIFAAANVLLIFYWDPLLKIVKNSALIIF